MIISISSIVAALDEENQSKKKNNRITDRGFRTPLKTQVVLFLFFSLQSSSLYFYLFFLCSRVSYFVSSSYLDILYSSQHKMSNTNERKPKNAKTQQQIESTNYINQVLGGEKKSTSDPEVRKKIELVKGVVREWNDEDILRVLQDCNNDPQQAINNIMDSMYFICNFYF